MTKVKVGDFVAVVFTHEEFYGRVSSITQDPQREGMKRKGWIRARVTYLTGPCVGRSVSLPHNRLRRLSLLEQMALVAAFD